MPRESTFFFTDKNYDETIQYFRKHVYTLKWKVQKAQPWEKDLVTEKGKIDKVKRSFFETSCVFWFVFLSAIAVNISAFGACYFKSIKHNLIIVIFLAFSKGVTF